MDDKKAKIAQSKSAVSLLHELLVKTGSVAKYELVYDWTIKTTNVPKFTWKITVGDKEAFGTANTKKKAKQDAARNMFMQISENISLLQTLQSSTQSTEENFQNHIGNLSMFCSRNKLPQPQYSEDMENGPAHQRSFYWNVVVGKHREVGIAGSTKAAKQLAAQAMYLKLVNEVNEPNDVHLPDCGQSEKFMPFKIEKFEKLARGENEDMEVDGNEYTEPISPEPFDDEESDSDAYSRQEFNPRERNRDYRRGEDRTYEENVHHRDTDRPSTSGYSSHERSHHSEGSRNIRIESEEVLERKYKMKLSSFTDWEIPHASPSTSTNDEIPQTFLYSHDEASRSTATQQNYCDVKREMTYSHSIRNTRMDEQSLMHRDANELNYSLEDQESVSPTPVVSNDPEGLENVDQTVDVNAEDQFPMMESKIDVTEHLSLPEVKFKIKLGGLITSMSIPNVSTVPTEPIIASPQVSNDRDEFISAPAVNIAENRAGIVDSVNLQADNKIGLRLMNVNRLMECGRPDGAKPDQNRIDVNTNKHSSVEGSTNASALTFNRTEEKSASHQHAKIVSEDSVRSEMMISSFKTETMDMAEENFLHSEQAASAESQVLVDNSDECAQVHQDCSNDNFPNETALSAIGVKNVHLEKFNDKSKETHGDNSSLPGTSKNADSKWKNQSSMDVSKDGKMSGDPFSHKSGPGTMSDVEVESGGNKSRKNSRKASDFLAAPNSKRQFLTEVHSNKLRDENVTSKNERTLNLNVQPKSELLIGNEEQADLNVNYSNRVGSEDQVHMQDSLARNPNSSGVLREPEDSVIEIKQSLQMRISEYYHMMLTEKGIDLKPKICNKVCDLIDALSKWDVVKNPHIVEEGLDVLKDILMLIDLHLERVVYEAHDKDYIVVIRINSIPEIVETTKDSDLNEANRSVFFKVIHSVNKMLL